MKSKYTNKSDPGETQRAVESAAMGAEKPDLKDPRIVLSLLEADQVVAAKRRTHFGLRKFSFGLEVLLWGLRIYVVVMMVIVLISVFRAFHGMH